MRRKLLPPPQEDITKTERAIVYLFFIVMAILAIRFVLDKRESDKLEAKMEKQCEQLNLKAK